MAGSNSHVIILTLNVNWLHAPIKRQRLVNWIKRQDLLVCCVQKTHFMCKETHRLTGMEEDLPSKWRAKEKKKAGVAILVSDKMDFNKDQKRQRRALHNGKKINATSRANYPKYLCTQYRSTQIHKVTS